MTERPDFKRPPVVEVAIGVQFAESLNFRTFDYIDAWNTYWRDEYPNLGEMPVLDNIGINVPLIQFGNVGAPRYWFQNGDGSRILQLQHNRLIYNWRKEPGTDAPYPHYDQIVVNFLKACDEIVSFASDNGQTLTPQIGEIAYVDMFDIPDGNLNRLDDFLIGNFDLGRPSELPAPVATNHFWQYQLDDPISILSVSTGPFYVNGKVALKMDIQCNGPLPSLADQGTVEKMSTWYNTTHDRMNDVFMSITTDKAKDMWGIE